MRNFLLIILLFSCNGNKHSYKDKIVSESLSSVIKDYINEYDSSIINEGKENLYSVVFKINNRDTLVVVSGNLHFPMIINRDLLFKGGTTLYNRTTLFFDYLKPCGSKLYNPDSLIKDKGLFYKPMGDQIEEVNAFPEWIYKIKGINLILIEKTKRIKFNDLKIDSPTGADLPARGKGERYP